MGSEGLEGDERADPGCGGVVCCLSCVGSRVRSIYSPISTPLFASHAPHNNDRGPVGPAAGVPHALHVREHRSCWLRTLSHPPRLSLTDPSHPSCLSLFLNKSLLSITAPEDQGALVFAAVFFVVWFGAAVVTLNAQLLGGTMYVHAFISSPSSHQSNLAVCSHIHTSRLPLPPTHPHTAAVPSSRACASWATASSPWTSPR